MTTPPDGPLSERTKLGRRFGRRPDTLLLGLLMATEYALLYLVSFVLLAGGIGVLALLVVDVAREEESWAERFLIVIEALLLILIIVEIFLTVLAHLEGGRLQLEPFILVGVIALVRHIVSVVVRLAVPGAPPTKTAPQLLEIPVTAAGAFLLVSALALARWSRRWDTE